MHFKSFFSQKLEKTAKLLTTICKTSFLYIQQSSKYVVRKMTLPLRQELSLRTPFSRMWKGLVTKAH